MNLPNKISLFRFFCTPVMIALFLIPIPYGIGKFCALFVFIVGSISDMVDGYIARKYNLITDFGKFIDQIADKFLATTALLLVVMSGQVGMTYAWVGTLIVIIVVLRDILIGGIRQIAAKNGTVIAADFFGKIKSIFIDVSSMILMLYIAISEIVISPATNNFLRVVKTAGVSVLIVGTFLAIISCVNYTINALPALKGTSGIDNKQKEETK